MDDLARGDVILSSDSFSPSALIGREREKSIFVVREKKSEKMVKKNRKRLSALLDDEVKPAEKVEEKKTEKEKPKTLKESLKNDQEHLGLFSVEFLTFTRFFINFGS